MHFWKKNKKLIIITIVILAAVILIAISMVQSYGIYVVEDNEGFNKIAIINKNDYGVDKDQTNKIEGISYPGKKYTISPESKPLGFSSDNSIVHDGSYNKNNKHYYTINSYMENFEKSGGGTLILKKGTYWISESIAVPSNVTIILEDGVVIKKWMKTGTNNLDASTAIFQLIAPSKVKGKGIYGKYEGTHDVNIVGKGNATIDLRYQKGSLAFVCGHNKNIKIQGITFKHLNTGHFIELDATNNMKITNCKFIDSKASPKLDKEAINIDTPDKETNGFHNPWSKYDKTPNKNIIIENNEFNGVDRAVGTHKYSQDEIDGKYVTNKNQKYHDNITIKNNVITNTRGGAIRVLNWENSEIVNNYISNVTKIKHQRGIIATGSNITIKYNYFVNMGIPVQFFPSKNKGSASYYSVTYNNLSKENMNDLQYNICENVSESFTQISNIYNSFSNQIKIPMVVE